MRTPIRALVVDDEPLGRRRIRRALERHPDVEVVGEAEDGNSALEQISELKPNLVFMDIRMPGRSGLAVLDEVAADARPFVVFVTAHDEHALEAFRLHATDYLVKPFDADRFDEMMRHARRRIGAGGTVTGDQVHALLTKLDPRAPVPAPPARRIRITSGERTRFLPVDEVRYFEADGNYVLVHTGAATHRIRTTLTGLLDRMDPAVFVRIHRGTAINLDHLKEIQPWFSGDYVAILADGTQLRVSRTHREGLLRLSF